MDQDDPADWSIDRVIQEICHEAAPVWKTGTNLKPVINPEAVAKALRDNDIDGDNLLALEEKDVRNDLSMTSFGQRRAFINIIEHLRSLSSKYQVQLSRRSVAAWATPQMSHFSIDSHARSPSFAGSTVQQTVETNKNNDGTPARVIDTQLGAQDKNNPRKRQLECLNDDAAHMSESAQLQHTHNGRPVFVAGSSTINEKPPRHEDGRVRSGILSSMLDDASNGVFEGQVSRHQSFLNTLDTAIDHELDTNKDTNARSEVPKEISNTLPSLQASGKKTPKRATLIPVTDPIPSADNASKFSRADDIDWMPDIVHANTKDQVSNAQNTDGQLSPPAKRLKLVHNAILTQKPGSQSQVVFSTKSRRQPTRADQLVQPKSHALPKEHDNVQVDDSTTFLILGSKSSTGPMHRAARRVLPIHIDQSQHSSANLSSNEPVQADTPQGDLPQQPAFSHWAQAKPDFDLSPELFDLLRKYPTTENDHTFPSYGDSDEEDRMWTPESETPAPEDRRLQVVLSRDEIDLIIDQTFDKYREDWRVRCLPKVQMKAHRKWMSAAKNKALHGSTIRELDLWRSRATARIQHLRKGIHLNEWRKAEDVKQQCDAIEVSVHLLAEYEYYLQVLHCEHEPSMPPRVALAKSRQPRQRMIMDNGDEDLESESGNSFVVSDDDWNPMFKTQEVQQDPERPAWNPKFAEKLRQLDRERSVGTLYQGSGEDTVVDSIERHSTPAVSRTNFDHVGVAHKVDDIMEIDGQDLQFSSGRRDRSAKKQAAIDSAKRNPITVPFLTDSEDDSDLERRPSLPQTKFRKHGTSRVKAIDLTQSSSPTRSERQGSFRSELEVRTSKPRGSNPPMGTFWPKSNRNSKSVDPIVPSTSINRKSKTPENYLDIKWVLQKEWKDIEPIDETDVTDTRLALAKSVYDLSVRRSQRILDYLISFRDELDLVDVLSSGLHAEKAYDEQIEDVEQKNQDNAKGLTQLFITYVTGCCVDSESDITEEQIDRTFTVLERGPSNFQALLKKLLQHHIHYRTSDHPSKTMMTEEFSVDTDSDIEYVGSPSKAKKPGRRGRQRRVIQNEDVVLQQRLDQHRAYRQEVRRHELLKKQSALGVGQDKLSIAISASEPLVYLDPRIAARVKPHQIEGIRFMWREIVEDPRSQGCLLAHTMGLGKTLQVISVLASIAQCNKSSDPLVRDLIPQHLRRLRIMVLCPRGLIDNWFEELSNWLPDPMMLGVLIKVDNFVRQPETTLRTWYTGGGVLIISYERFRKFVVSQTSGSLTPMQIEERRFHLLEGPDIVIADEAHRLKNARSKLNEAACQIVTKSRIAMTGSPLNNHLEEYHTMIEWVAPGYLGESGQFKAKYVEPISQGLYNESSAWERKASMKKLHVLKRILAPKIHRADITAISKDLPPKTEFFLTITLTNVQKRAYQLYIEELRASSTTKLGNTRLWDWLSLLSLLLNHPSCFIRKIREREDAKATANPHTHRAESSDDGEDNMVPAFSAEDLDVKDQPALAGAMRKVKDVFAVAQLPLGLEDPSLSHKTLLVKQIIEEAVKHKEKTLIFSQSILTLDYYETMLKAMGMDYNRIDGSKTSAKNRQEEVAKFNKSRTASVFLISTRAGGLGLNIQSATRVIINDFNFNPSWEEQAIGRAYRMGQTKPVFVYRFLVGGTFEELVHNKAVFKTQLFTRVVDEQKVKSQAAKRPGEFLFDPKEVPQRDFGDCIGKDPNVLDRVLTKVDCIRHIFLTETFFQEDDDDLNEQELKEADEELAMERLERENPTEFKRRKEEMDQRAAQERSRLFNNAISQQTVNTQLPGMPLTSGAQYGHQHFVDLRGAIQSGVMSPSAAWSTIPSLHTLPPQYMNFPGPFGDEFIPSTRHATQVARPPPRAIDDQMVYDAPSPTPHIASTPTTNHGTGYLETSPYFGLANNGFVAGTPLLNRVVTRGTHTSNIVYADNINKEFNSGNDATESSTANGATNVDISEQSVQRDKENTDTDKADAPSGCRPQ